MLANRLTHAAVKSVRQQQYVQQGGLCVMCKLPMKLDDSVLDHCHTTGAIRGTAHRSCNALLGKVENNHARFGMPRSRLPAFLHGIAGYLQLHSTNITGMLHPTHKTEDEKRIRRNKLAVKRRAVAKKKA